VGVEVNCARAAVDVVANMTIVERSSGASVRTRALDDDDDDDER